MRKKIGFFQSDDDLEEEKAEKRDHFREYIAENFKPNGECEEMEMFTSLELQHHLSEQMFVTIIKINDTLSELGYEQRNIHGEATWILYTKNERLPY